MPQAPQRSCRGFACGLGLELCNAVEGNRLATPTALAVACIPATMMPRASEEHGPSRWRSGAALPQAARHHCGSAGFQFVRDGCLHGNTAPVQVAVGHLARAELSLARDLLLERH